MKDLIERRAAIDALDEIRHALWEIDIPSPTVPEYIEHHEQIQSVWKLLDKKQKELYILPSAQPKSYREGYQAGFKDAQSEQPWIPCSERLPDRFGKMLVTFIPRTLWTYVIIANYSDLMGIAKPCFWIGNVGKSDFANITSRVVAWMPLPEPYKPEVEE